MKFKQIIRLLLFLPLIYYIYILLNYDNNVLLRKSIDNKFVSKHFNFDKEGEITFIISSEEWPFKNELDNELLLLSLEFDQLPKAREESNLTFRTRAYSIVDNKMMNRLILNDYVNISDTIVLKDRISYGDRYKIGLLSNFSYEDIIVKIEVLQADRKLHYFNPRLLVESYRGSSGVWGFGMLGVHYTNFILIISILCLIIYVWIGLHKENKKIKNQLPTQK